MYVQKGWKYENSPICKATISADEIVIAPFIVLRFPPVLSGKITPFFQIGPEIGFNLGYDVEWSCDVSLLNSYNTSPMPWNDINLSMNFGLGVAIPMGKSELILDYRDNLGLVDMMEWREPVKTKGLQFFIGYSFSIPGK